MTQANDLTQDYVRSFIQRHATHNEVLMISLPELFDKRLNGVIESSLQITQQVDIEWLLAQYAVNNKSTRITLLYSHKDPKLQEALDKNLLPNVKAIYMKPSLFGSNYTKMMILAYENGSFRVVVTTGNLIKRDWESTTQGIWVSPALPRIKSGPTGADVGDSETRFKKDLLDYLEAYKLPEVEPWIQKVRNADCKEVKQEFIANHSSNASKKCSSQLVCPDRIVNNHHSSASQKEIERHKPDNCESPLPLS